MTLPDCPIRVLPALLLALAATSLPQPAAAGGLGRLFTTPAEREARDHPPLARRPLLAPASAPARRSPAAADPAQAPDLSGFVLRSSGRDTFWLAAPAGGAAVAAATAGDAIRSGSERSGAAGPVQR